VKFGVGGIPAVDREYRRQRTPLLMCHRRCSARRDGKQKAFSVSLLAKTNNDRRSARATRLTLKCSSILFNKKAVLLQGNRAMPQLFFSV